jgi:tetratricopeptide (TPR) repeat protein
MGFRELRSRLVANPRNAFRWVDFARLYTIEGERRKAQRAMDVAYALAPEDRHVLRSASRLAFHHGRTDKAHAILAGAERTNRDPWLVASEIATATAAGSQPGMVRRAREMLESGRFSDFDLTELASALATLELTAGDLRTARRLFRRALAQPTDNTIAQATWASPQLRLSIDPSTLSSPSSWEARAMAAQRVGDWEPATDQAWSWLEDQPFASRPAVFGSYEASKGGQFERGAEFALRGLKANEDEFLLRNNVSFCLLSADRVTEARDYFDLIEPRTLDRHDRAVYLATKGLFLYRTGRPGDGRASYLESMRSTRDPNVRAMAAIMLAREELIAGQPTAGRAVEQARKLHRQVATKELQPWLNQLQVKRARLPRRKRSG